METVLKLLSQSKENQPLDIEPILTTLTANIHYLQDEYSALLVKGKFDDSTAQLFRSLQKGNSGFDQQSINNVRIAAELSSIAARNAQSPRGTFRSVYRSQSNSAYPYSGYYNTRFLEFETFNEKLQFPRVVRGFNGNSVFQGASSKQTGSSIIRQCDHSSHDQWNGRFIRTVRFSSQKYSFRGHGGEYRINRQISIGDSKLASRFFVFFAYTCD